MKIAVLCLTLFTIACSSASRPSPARVLHEASGLEEVQIVARGME